MNTQEMKQLTVWIPEDLRCALKLEALEQNTTVKELVTRILVNSIAPNPEELSSATLLPQTAPPVTRGSTWYQEKAICDLLLNYYNHDVVIRGESHWLPDYVLNYIEDLRFADPVWRTIRQHVEECVEVEHPQLDYNPLIAHTNKQVRNRTVELLGQPDSLFLGWEERFNKSECGMANRLGEIAKEALYHYQVAAIDVLFQHLKAQFENLDRKDIEQVRKLQTELHNLKQLEKKLSYNRKEALDD